jgi:hypothetical protein
MVLQFRTSDLVAMDGVYIALKGSSWAGASRYVRCQGGEYTTCTASRPIYSGIQNIRGHMISWSVGDDGEEYTHGARPLHPLCLSASVPGGHDR